MTKILLFFSISVLSLTVPPKEKSSDDDLACKCCEQHPVDRMISDAEMWRNAGYTNAKHIYSSNHGDIIKFTIDSNDNFEEMHKKVDDYYRTRKPCWMVGSVGSDYVYLYYAYCCNRDSD